MANPINIEQLRPSDLRRVMEIQLECGLSHWTHRDYTEELVRTDSLMVKAVSEAGECVGFLVGRRIPGDESQNEFEVYNIGVSTLMQRKGIGTALIEELLHVCKRDRIKAIWLDVRLSNNNARAFYEQFGFLNSTIRRNFYRDPVEDGIVMKLTVE